MKLRLSLLVLRFYPLLKKYTDFKPLDSKVLGRLEQSISKSPLIQKGQKVRMENKVNETILGGLIVEIGDRTIDLSVQSRISKLNQLLYETL